MKENILFVDDDPNLLSGLRRMLRPMRDEWEMTFAPGPREALDLMQKLCFDVVVVDMRMPEMDGAQLLEEVRNICPHSVRIVLSGQAELETIFRVVNPAHQYLSKPCDAEALKELIRRSTELRDSLVPVALKEGVSCLESLPLSAISATLLQKEFEAAEPNTANISRIASADLCLAPKLLKAVNSAFFGPRRAVASVSKACGQLGGELIRQLLAADVANAEPMNSPFDRFIRSLCKSARVAAAVADSIVQLEQLEPEVAEAIKIAAFLRDIGEIVLMKVYPDWYLLYGATVVNDREPEKAVFGATHADVGAYLMALWGIPPAVVDAVRYHESPRLYTGPHVMPVMLTAAVSQLMDRHNVMREGAGGDQWEWLTSVIGERDIVRWEGICAEQQGLIPSVPVKASLGAINASPGANKDPICGI